MTEINSNNSGIGQVQIADEVIAIIAGTAAHEVDGVGGVMSGPKGDAAETRGKKNLSKGVKVSMADGKTIINIVISVKFGYKIPEVSTNVQARVKNAVETMTGLTVSETNIIVTGIQMEKGNAKTERV